MKKILVGLLTFMAVFLIWYLFFKPSDYIIRFETKTIPGAINQTIKLWHNTLDTVGPVQQKGENIYELAQKMRFGDSVHIYNWKIKSINDSTSKVVVHVTDENHSLINKIRVPFSDTDFEKRSRKTVRDLMENLKEHREKFKVTIIGEEKMPTKYLAYIPIKATQFQKAGGMMKNYSYLTQTLLENQIQLDGQPMVVINEWDRVNDSLDYIFAMPIVRSDRLPMVTDIKYKRFFAKKALKAIYNGNYITSDRAWYALLDYAKKRNIEVEAKPVEIFFNNPNTGSGERNWKAEIYMPIRDSDD